MHVVDNKDSPSFQLHPTSSAFAMGFRLSELNMYEASVKRDYLRTHLAVSIKLFTIHVAGKRLIFKTEEHHFVAFVSGLKHLYSFNVINIRFFSAFVYAIPL